MVCFNNLLSSQSRTRSVLPTEWEKRPPPKRVKNKYLISVPPGTKLLIPLLIVLPVSPRGRHLNYPYPIWFKFVSIILLQTPIPWKWFALPTLTSRKMLNSFQSKTLSKKMQKTNTTCKRKSKYIYFSNLLYTTPCHAHHPHPHQTPGAFSRWIGRSGLRLRGY